MFPFSVFLCVYVMRHNYYNVHACMRCICSSIGIGSSILYIDIEFDMYELYICDVFRKSQKLHVRI